jgi:hypothetical protein
MRWGREGRGRGRQKWMAWETKKRRSCSRSTVVTNIFDN